VVMLLVVHHWDHGCCAHFAFGRLLVASFTEDEEGDQPNDGKSGDASNNSTGNGASVTLRGASS